MILKCKVNIYNIKQVELGLRGAQTWNEWRDNMIVRYNNASENNLYMIFSDGCFSASFSV